jgi:hypothetical protein
MSKTMQWAGAAALLVAAGSGHASLINRGGGMIYDTVNNITWLADMNYAVTSGYAAANAGGTGSNQVLADGRMGLDAANIWASNLVYGGFDDWRLPTLNPADTSCSGSLNPNGGFPPVGNFPRQYYGSHCTGGEMSHLFVADLGNLSGSVLNQAGDTAEQVANMAMFSHVRSYAYWSGTLFAPGPTFAWLINTASGVQAFDSRDTAAFALAVRTGDMAASIPEPQTLMLTLLALTGAVVTRRRRIGKGS